MDWMAQLEVMMGAALAMGLGGLVGLERELKDRPAGFRIHMLVAGAAASLLMVAVIGIATGLQYYLLAFASTALTLVVLAVLKFFDGYLKRKRDS